jgi:hypothetical protein
MCIGPLNERKYFCDKDLNVTRRFFPMPTECTPDRLDFARVEGRAVVASFTGARMTSDAGALLLGATDRVLGLTRRLATCFKDDRDAAYTEYAVETLVMQRVVGIARGYEDLNDHDQLRPDPVLAGKLAASRADRAPLAGKSTLNRLELGRAEPTRYHKIAADAGAIESLFTDLFLEAHAKPPGQITLDLDATDDPGIRKAASSTATTTATAICRCISFAAGTCWRRSCAAPTSTPRPARWRRLPGWRSRSAPAGPGSASCCVATAAFAARR